LSDCQGQVKCVFGQVKTAPNLSDRASENDSVICSIPEEQNYYYWIIQCWKSQEIVEYHKNISYQISINHKVFKFQSSIQEFFSLKELSNWKPRYITVHQNLRVGKVWEVTTLNLCSKKEIISDSKGSITQYSYKFHSSSKLENRIIVSFRSKQHPSIVISVLPVFR
jgi:hypothetical protein